MKKHFLILVSLLVFLVAIPIFASAAGFNFSGLALPTGGKIIKSGPSAELVCSALYGPLFIRPVNFAPSGPFFIRTGSFFPRAGGLILMNYKVIPDVGTCYNPATGIPVPAFELKPYGTSR